MASGEGSRYENPLPFRRLVSAVSRCSYRERARDRMSATIVNRWVWHRSAHRKRSSLGIVLYHHVPKRLRPSSRRRSELVAALVPDPARDFDALRAIARPQVRDGMGNPLRVAALGIGCGDSESAERTLDFFCEILVVVDPHASSDPSKHIAGSGPAGEFCQELAIACDVALAL